MMTYDVAVVADGMIPYEDEDDDETYHDLYKPPKYQSLDEPMILIESKYDTQKEMRECRVCSDRSDGAHFGIDSCRACAAFFRRSVVMSKSYVCRQGGNNCIINKSVRCMCRKCRMRKCLEAGMLPENVQNRRDPIIPRRQDDAIHMASSSTSDMGGTPSPSDNETIRTGFQIVSPTNGTFTPFPSVIKNPPEEPLLLNKIRDGYRNLCAIRRGIELSMNPSIIKDMFSSEIRSEQFLPATSKSTSQLYRQHMPSISTFVMDTFHEFNMLKEEDKWSIFQPFLAHLWCLDGAYRTYKLEKEMPEVFSNRYMITETRYVDLNNVDFFVSDSPTTKIGMANLVSMMRQCMNGPRLKALNYMREMSTSDEEVAALIALLLWNPNVENCSTEVAAFLKENRTKIFHQLHLLYKFKNLDNYAERMGDLMCLFTCLLHQTTRMREDMELFNIFDVFAEDSFIYNMIKQK